jgi:putative tryptophan/tyrosine transport system permease protein
MIEGILVEGLIYALMVLGVFITFRILDFPDLTVDGTFPLGAALAALFITSGQNVYIAILLAFAGGTLAGALTALIHTRLRVPNLLAGILTMTMLYSVNIRILGNKANVPFLKQETALTGLARFAEGWLSFPVAELIYFAIVVFMVKIALDIFFRTDLGLSLEALGNNEQLVKSLGINPDTLKLIGVGLSNGLVAMSGAFTAQYQGFADVGMGQGIIISGLASVMIGEYLFHSRKIWVLTLCAVLGSIIFKGIMYFGRDYGYLVGLTPNDLKLITGLLIIASLILTRLRKIKAAGASK